MFIFLDRSYSLVLLRGLELVGFKPYKHFFGGGSSLM